MGGDASSPIAHFCLRAMTPFTIIFPNPVYPKILYSSVASQAMRVRGAIFMKLMSRSLFLLYWDGIQEIHVILLTTKITDLKIQSRMSNTPFWIYTTKNFKAVAKTVRLFKSLLTYEIEHTKVSSFLAERMKRTWTGKRRLPSHNLNVENSLWTTNLFLLFSMRNST